MDRVLGQDRAKDEGVATQGTRKAWEPLGYEKIPAADATATLGNSGADANIYS